MTCLLRRTGELLPRRITIRLLTVRNSQSLAVSEDQDIDGDETTPPSNEWTPKSRRTGVIGVKLGMSQMWDKNGLRIPVTMLQVLDNQVVMVRRREKEGYDALQIGAVEHDKIKRIIKPVMGQFNAAGVPPKRFLQEFRVTPNAFIPVGTQLQASHYSVGHYVDVSAKTIGKGFQGVMKRHGMKGMPASHGVTKTHRKMGATGGGQDPGRVWPGKRMPGRMGGKTTTTLSLKVLRVNHQYNVLYVKGCVPGHDSTPVRIVDAKKMPHKTPPPFPTHFIDTDGEMGDDSYSDEIHKPEDPSIEFPSKPRDKKRR